MTTTHHIHRTANNHDVTFARPRRGRWIGLAATGLATTSAVVAVAVGSLASPGTTTNEPASTNPQPSALLDGNQFTAAIDLALVDVDTTPSALLDGDQFTEAIDLALVDIETQPSALLDGAQFAAAIDLALADVDTTPSALLDGDRFAATVEQAMAQKDD